MKRNKSPDGYRNKMLQVRLTEVEDAAFQMLYEKAKINNDGLLVSDFIRRQLLFEVITDIEIKLDNLKNEMEMMNSGNNDFEESERS